MLHASFPRSVTLTQLRFTSFAVINSWRDLHPQECAHAGRTAKGPPIGGPLVSGAGNRSRTYDLRITNALLYQLSYAGENADFNRKAYRGERSTLALHLSFVSCIMRAISLLINRG